MPITIVLEGRALPTVTPVVMQGGTILAPLSSVADRIATAYARFPGGTIELRNGSHVVRLRSGTRRVSIDGSNAVLPVAPLETIEDVMIPLAAVARGLGESVTYDAATRTVFIRSLLLPKVLNMTPAPPVWPSPPPVEIFTPQPPKTPVPVVTPPVHPRRTPIPVIPDPGRVPL